MKKTKLVLTALLLVVISFSCSKEDDSSGTPPPQDQQDPQDPNDPQDPGDKEEPVPITVGEPITVTPVATNYAELLVEGSPWAFDHIEIIEISEGHDKTTVENEYNERFSVDEILFYADGTGIKTPFYYFTWEVINGNTVEINDHHFQELYFLTIANTNDGQWQLIREQQEFSVVDLVVDMSEEKSSNKGSNDHLFFIANLFYNKAN